MRQSFFQRDVEDKSEYADRDYLTRTYGADGEQIRLGNLIRKFEHKRHDYVEYRDYQACQEDDNAPTLKHAFATQIVPKTSDSAVKTGIPG